MRRRGTEEQGRKLDRVLYALWLCGDSIDHDEGFSAVVFGKRWAIAALAQKLTILRQQQIDVERIAQKETRERAKKGLTGRGRGGHKAVPVHAIAYLAAEMVGRCASGRFTLPVELADLLRLHLGANTFKVPKTWGDLWDRAFRYCVDHPLPSARALGRALGVTHKTAGSLLQHPEFRSAVEEAGGQLQELVAIGLVR